jgi:putative ABC transport system permease protein
MVLAAVFGLLTAITFSLLPLARARMVAPASLFRDLIAPVGGFLTPRTLAVVTGLGVSLAVLAVVTATDRWLAFYFVIGAIATLILFRLTALLVIALARRAGRPRNPGLRLAITNLHRPGAATASVILSLGLGLTVLVAIALIEANLTYQVRQSLPAEAPAFYFIDIQSDQVEEFDRLVTATPGARDLQRVPMLRGRISRVNGVPPSELEIPSHIEWIFRGDRGLTWTRTPPQGAELVAGDWWPPDHGGETLVSLDAEVGEGLGIGPGDKLTINILGRDIDVTIANLRKIDWSDLAINFVMVFSPGLLETAPQTHIATVKADGDAEDALEIAVTDRFVNVSAVKVKDALDQFGQMMRHVAVAVRAIAAFAILAGILVLAGAVAAGNHRRVYDAVVLKVLGATKALVGRAYLMEFGLLGAITAVLAAGIGSLAAYLVLTHFMHSEFVFLPATVFWTAALAAAITLAFGFAGTLGALRQKAAPLLRNE